MSQFNVAGDFGDRYQVAPMAQLIEHAGARVNGRPLLDIYLDAALAIHGLLVPAQHGHGVTAELEDTMTRQVAASTRLLAKSAPGLSSNAQRNRDVALGIHERRIAWIREASEAPDRVFFAAGESRETSDPDLVWLLDALRDVRRVASVAVNAVAYERRLGWRLIREVGDFPNEGDIALAIRLLPEQ